MRKLIYVGANLERILVPQIQQLATVRWPTHRKSQSCCKKLESVQNILGRRAD